MRSLRPEEHDAADSLLRAAFPSPAEAALVRALRRDGVMEAEFVLPSEDGLAAYLALSRMTAPQGWLALAPLAVHPDWQGKKLGSRLLAGVMRLMSIKGVTTVVLGDPGFYARAGFSTARAAGLTSRYPVSHTLIARPGDDAPKETLIYPQAFDAI